jgi:hypothetical protein
MRSICIGLLAAFFACSVAPLAVNASTTGSVRGRVTDSETNAPVGGARVTIESPSQQATTTTDSSGSFAFLSLQPDTYTLHVEKANYDPASQPGVTVQADQSSALTIAISPALKTIARVTSRGAGSLVRPGTTSDVYAINAAGQRATQTVAGSGSLNQAYGAIASVPGVSMPTGQQGWYQTVYIRGGDSDQVAYEFDGVNVIRQSDLAPIVTLSSLGQQEVQIYTGGTPATSNSSGLAGYINQVIKTGTYPGYANVQGSVGSPQFYHLLSLETGGSSPDRTFSYYFGIAGANQTYRYVDQFNGVSDPLYFYPLQIQSSNALYNVVDGSCTLPGAATPCVGDPAFGTTFSPGNSYFQATNYDRETVANFHFAIPHKNNSLRDDVQLLYVTGGIADQFYSSYNDSNYGQITPALFGTAAVPWLDSTYYAGTLGQAPDPTKLVVGPFPSSPTNRAFNNTTTTGTNPNPSLLGVNQRDGNYNGFSIEKLQYQKNFNDRSFLRLTGYSEYTNWFINGPNSAQFVFAATPADYEVWGHVGGATLAYTNQLSAKHNLTASLAYMVQYLGTYNAEFGSTGLGSIISSYVGNDGNCYNYTTGSQWSCFDIGSQGGLNANTGGVINLTPGDCVAAASCTFSNATTAGAHWTMTENGYAAQLNKVTPYFYSAAVTDIWQPNDRLLFNVGARIDAFHYKLDDTATGYPTRAFWFNAYNNENCAAPAQDPISTFTADPTVAVPFGSCPSGFQPMSTPGVGLQNSVPSSITQWVFQPRAAFTYTLNQNTVLRASYGRYARPGGSYNREANTVEQNLPGYIAQFYKLGYNTPFHDLLPDTSNNYDLSWEQHIKGTQYSFKISPFYRDTQNQLQYFAINAATGIVTGVNVGTQTSKGVEVSFQGGDFARDGLSFLLSYTYTDSKVHYRPVANGVSVLDNINNSIALYNSYTSACAGLTSAACGGAQAANNATATLTNASGSTIANPYFNAPTQPLLNTGASYSTYDVIPGPFNSANGFAVPDVATLVLNYRHKRFAITPSITYNSGSYYGSPLSWPGYVPQSCTLDPATTPTPGASCSGSYTLPSGATFTPGVVFLPDPYTHHFDSLGSLKQPWQLTANLQASYDVTPRMSVTMIASNIFNKCYQRGYAWDNPHFCIYSNLSSNILAPAGNFLGTNAAGIPTAVPVQLRYPYGVWTNQNEVGYTPVLQPFQLTVNLNVKL